MEQHFGWQHCRLPPPVPAGDSDTQTKAGERNVVWAPVKKAVPHQARKSTLTSQNITVITIYLPKSDKLHHCQPADDVRFKHRPGGSGKTGETGYTEKGH